MKVALALVLALLGPSTPLAQAPAGDSPPAGSASIRGRVFAAVTGAALRNARAAVTLGDQAVGTVFTDDEGRFVVPSRAPGGYRIAASKTGYITTSFAGQGGRAGESETLIRVVNLASSRGRDRLRPFHQNQSR